ncbi:MAG: hypothetical protein COZ17_08485 [Flavobacteriaceae bacterium CG_4_10_14_3_um_filter_33_47]|nr:MAG: hypothetical protein COW44_03010 [Flavobacteriaceae bacterium CG17_big_fil_post_rev_8_21_14_2_50_33_15]PIY10866.1 MAG: hypothetical protein COZ17_08485 [Flavobacteriaceae bacterium CG_4_10_14_3_um_filter_33_47]PJB20567.1 MAG: hypothetical protein CO117_00585 [Flavobacteriaceae bacterium CG_4_9_14_3_um_filter_33_16]
MKSYLYFLMVLGLIVSCSTKKIVNKKDTALNQTTSNDTIRIANDDLEYEIIIIEPGFQTWLASTARPEGFYSQTYLENRNIIYVTEWNNRVFQPQLFNPNLYELQIDYQRGIDYGYDVNYKLYNYFIYFQLTYKQQLDGRVPRI